MAGVNPLPAEIAERPHGPSNLDLFSAVADLRWRLLINSLRTVRGRLELLSRAFVGLTIAMVAFGGAAFMAPVAYFSLKTGHPEYIAIVLWVIFGFWQLFPLMGSLASAPFEFATLLRFPLRFSTYWWLAFAYGLVDPVCIVSLLWMLAMLGGIGVASPVLLPGAALVLLIFALLNLFLSRAAYLWLERWLARRKSRELLGVFFIFFIVGMQFVGPLVARMQPKPRDVVRQVTLAVRIATVLPPGLAGMAIREFDRGDSLLALGGCAALGAYTALLLALFNARLHAQFRGENLSEAAAPVAAVRATGKIREGWNLPGLPPSLAAIVEKETRYLMRSGPVLFMFVMPVVVLAIFRLNPGRPGHANAMFLNAAPDWAFPLGAAYALLVLTNIVYNSFGADGGGVQFFIMSPVRMRDVLLAKNIAHTMVMAIDFALVFIATTIFYRLPRLDIAFVTLCALLFAFPLNLAAGNLMSVYSPRRYDLATFGRQRATASTGVVGMLVQSFVVGVSAIVIVVTAHFEEIWIAAPIFLLLAIISFTVYWLLLNKSAQAAMNRREVLVAEITRVSSDETASGRAS